MGNEFRDSMGRFNKKKRFSQKDAAPYARPAAGRSAHRKGIPQAGIDCNVPLIRVLCGPLASMDA